MARARRKFSLRLLAFGTAAAVVGLGGAASMSHLRARPAPVMQIVSGSPALKKSSDGNDVRWHTDKTTIYLDASLDAAGSGSRDAVQQGFGTWLSSGAKIPGLAFNSTQGATFGTPDGKNEIMYGPITLAGHETNLALTITFSDPTTGEVIEADMIFNSLYPFGLLPAEDAASPTPTTIDPLICGQRYDLQSVATHEAGHFFGLGEDYDSKVATMYYTTGRCETNKRVLQGSDETTMDALYVKSAQVAQNDSSETSKAGCGGARIGQGKTSGTAPTLALVGLLGFIALRRRRR